MPTTPDDVLALLDLLADCGPIVGGGWGVDALAGRGTRDHADLDLAIDADRLDRAVELLAAAGYGITTDWLPVRVELSHPGGAIVDLHPVHWGEGGDGTQHGLDVTEYHYPSREITTGTIGGRVVRCISAELQRRFHEGYELGATDRHDLAILTEL